MKLAVVTLAIGERMRELTKLTHPRMIDYAAQCDATFKVIEEKQFPKSDIICYEKLQIADMLAYYDRILYLDADILVSRNAPNIFEQVPEDRVGVFEEGRLLDRGLAMGRAAEDGWGEFGEEGTKSYWNAGVFVLSSHHRPLLSPPPVFINNFEDQTWLNCQSLKLGILREPLPLAFDHMPSIDWDQRHKSFFIHYAGCGAELAAKLVAEDIANGM